MAQGDKNLWDPRAQIAARCSFASFAAAAAAAACLQTLLAFNLAGTQGYNNNNNNSVVTPSVTAYYATILCFFFVPFLFFINFCLFFLQDENF